MTLAEAAARYWPVLGLLFPVLVEILAAPVVRRG